MSDTTSAAAGLFAAMLGGIGFEGGPLAPDEPTLSVDDLREDGPYAVSAKVTVASGDAFLVRVEWLKDESP